MWFHALHTNSKSENRFCNPIQQVSDNSCQKVRTAIRNTFIFYMFLIQSLNVLGVEYAYFLPFCPQQPLEIG